MNDQAICLNCGGISPEKELKIEREEFGEIFRCPDCGSDHIEFFVTKEQYQKAVGELVAGLEDTIAGLELWRLEVAYKDIVNPTNAEKSRSLIAKYK